LGALSLGAPLLKRLPPAREPVAWGRIFESAVVRILPLPHATPVMQFKADDLIPLYGRVTAREMPDDPREQANIWRETDYGYVRAVQVQYCPLETPSPVVHPVPEPGRWLRVIVPYFDARADINDPGGDSVRVYYDAVFWCAESALDDAGGVWYGLRHQYDYDPEVRYWVPAENARFITPAQWRPISPGAEKSVVVSIAEQTLTAYEGTNAVRKVHVSTGTEFAMPNGSIIDRYTPEGQYFLHWKAPGVRLRSPMDWKPERYDYWGAPFMLFFRSDIGIHGVYWHNDFGVARSQGCINVRPHIARWLYFWTTPLVSYEQRIYYGKEHEVTPIRIEP
jgi:hypothetical protein